MNKAVRKYCQHICKIHGYTMHNLQSSRRWYWNLPAAVSICYYKNVSKKAYSHFSYETRWHTLIVREFKKIGSYGSHNSICKNRIGNCAEQHSGNKVLKSTKCNKLNDLLFSETIRPRTMEVITPCYNCKQIFPTL